MTLSFTWATNTNYGAGPDTGTPTKVNPSSTANGFIKGVIAAPQHINYLFDLAGDELAKALDGLNGGTYTLASPLIFAAGADLRINNSLEVLATGVVDLNSGAELTVQSGADIEVQSGGDIDVSGSINLLSGGTVLGSSGSIIRMDAAEDLTIDDSAEVYRLSLGSASAYASGGAPTWVPEGSGRGWRQADVSGPFDVSFPLPLPVGDAINTVTVFVDGGAGAGHSSLPAGTDRLCVKLVAVDTAGVATVLASRFDQSASVGAYDVSHTVVLTSGSLDSGSLPQTVANTSTYHIVVEGEFGANAIASTTLVSAVLGGHTARSYKSALMVY